jgi:hypothetical protein
MKNRFLKIQRKKVQVRPEPRPISSMTEKEVAAEIAALMSLEPSSRKKPVFIQFRKPK